MRIDIRLPGVASIISWLSLSLSLSGVAAAGPDVRLADAAKRKDAIAVAALLKQQVDVNAPQMDGATALHWAAHWNDLETAKLLLKAGARVDVTNDYGVTPLSLACADAGAAMVETLLLAGANPNTALPTGETPLMTATRARNLAAVTLLLGRGANVNAKEGSHGQTALMWAFSRDALDVARTLIDHGADIHARSDTGFTPLLFAVREGNFDAVRLLLSRGADANEQASDGGSVLLVATVRGHAKLAEFLLDQGADPRANGAGYTALHWVAGTWESQTTHEYNASPPQPAGWKDEWKAMIGVQGQAKLDLIKALLAHGADPNARTTKLPPRFGYSFQSFVRAGGSLLGATPFLIASAVADVPVMRLLVAGGADPLIKTNDKTTPLMVASGMTAIEEEHDIPESRHLEAVKLTLALGAEINGENDLGNRALHATGMLGYPAIAQFLVAEGHAELNPKNKAGETPLRVAEGTIVNAMFFIHENVATVLRKLGGESDGSGVCTGTLLERASVNVKSTVCEPAGAKAAPAPVALPKK